ncbi:MAG: bifunctional precorrin-2 dehydrogenase/sirohydrochlorin ferrochelatase [Dehalococcoidia bacterium]
MSYYPAFLDLRNKRCVVVGGGGVALRKVEMLLEHQAQVTVISPRLCEELERLEGKVTIAGRGYQKGDLEGAFVVVAATDDPVTNERIATDAEERGMLINVVDVPSLSNFIVPSYLKRGDLTVAVSTGGKSPALARRIRSCLEEEFGPEYADLIAVAEEVRSELKGKGIKVSPDAWQQALEIGELLELIRSGHPAEAKRKLYQTLMEAVR